jgi:hypothetical protein
MTIGKFINNAYRGAIMIKGSVNIGKVFKFLLILDVKRDKSNKKKIDAFEIFTNQWFKGSNYFFIFNLSII